MYTVSIDVKVLNTGNPKMDWEHIETERETKDKAIIAYETLRDLVKDTKRPLLLVCCDENGGEICRFQNKALISIGK